MNKITTLKQILNSQDSESSFAAKTVIIAALAALKLPMSWATLVDRYYMSIVHENEKFKKGFRRPVFCHQHFGSNCQTTDWQLYNTMFVFSISRALAKEHDLSYTKNGETLYRQIFALPISLIPMKKLHHYDTLVSKYEVRTVEKVPLNRVDVRYRAFCSGPAYKERKACNHKQCIPLKKGTDSFKDFTAKQLDFVSYLIDSDKQDDVIVSLMYPTSKPWENKKPKYSPKNNKMPKHIAKKFFNTK